MEIVNVYLVIWDENAAADGTAKKVEWPEFLYLNVCFYSSHKSSHLSHVLRLYLHLSTRRVRINVYTSNKRPFFYPGTRQSF